MKKSSIVKDGPEETLLAYDEGSSVLLRQFECRKDGTTTHVDIRLSYEEARRLLSLLKELPEETSSHKEEEEAQQETSTPRPRSPVDFDIGDRQL